MSDIIQLLPDSVANQIAAGEVIQRPASVVKELVENSIDAGATQIDILIVDAGKTSIQVIDNGKGMSDTDARLSFERHATSKIKKADDLFALRTMGFRGEALASIAAVAQVELKTRMGHDDLGTCLSIAGSRVLSQEPCSCAVGSSFKVENLFYNVPARRKFLKSNNTELNNIVAAFERIALVYPEISFKLHNNGVEMFSLRTGSLRQRIISVFGKRLNQDLLQVDVETTLCKIYGYVGKPEAARKKGALQYFFVNGRFMKHPYFNKAIATAFERLVSAGEQVPYFLYFDVPTESIDVNIHPTKTEIKFENEQAIWQILMAGVKEAIGRFSDIPAIDFDANEGPNIPTFNPNVRSTAPTLNYNPAYNPFSEAKQHTTANMEEWQQLYAGIEAQADHFSAPADVSNENADVPQLFPETHPAAAAKAVIEDKSPTHYQYKGSYIMTAIKSGLMIIDQHRAHVRVLYEQYLRMLDEQKAHTQKILFPEMIDLSVSDSSLLHCILEEMKKLGFDMESLGGTSYSVNGVPAGIEGLNIATLVDEMIANAMEGRTDIMASIDESLAHSLARSAALPRGQVLSNEEMEILVNNLFACENVNYTPNGKPIFSIFPQTDIERLFS